MVISEFFATTKSTSPGPQPKFPPDQVIDSEKGTILTSGTQLPSAPDTTALSPDTPIETAPFQPSPKVS